MHYGKLESVYSKSNKFLEGSFVTPLMLFRQGSLPVHGEFQKYLTFLRWSIVGRLSSIQQVKSNIQGIL